MTLRRVLTVFAVAIAVILAVSLLAGNLLGYPVLIGHIESESMEPTMAEGDGFVPIPHALAGDVESGDVVVFQSESIESGETTTHRVVETREDGYITQGDNNPFTDQGSGDPPVTDGEVKAVALTVNGNVVTIPHLGTAADTLGGAVDYLEGFLAGLFGSPQLGSDQLAILLFVLGMVALAGTFVTESNGRERARSRARSLTGVIDARYVLVGCLVVLWLGATAGMVGPGGTETYGIVSTEGDSENPTIIPAGETDSFDAELHNGGFVPTVSYLEAQSPGVDIESEKHRLSRNESVNATITFTAPAETGYYPRSMSEHRYFAILPEAVLDGAYSVHPWLPYILINTVLSVPVLVLWLVFRGQPSQIRLRRRDHHRTSGVLSRLRGS